MTIEYVLGFAFAHSGWVAVIRKNRPDWQAGRMNGIGGKVESSDKTYADAMQREFMEETGVVIHADKWRYVGTMKKDEGFHHEERSGFAVHIFTATDPRVLDVTSKTDEVVYLVCPDEVRLEKHLENVPWLIELCRLEVGHSGTRPIVTIQYP